MKRSPLRRKAPLRSRSPKLELLTPSRKTIAEFRRVTCTSEQEAREAFATATIPRAPMRKRARPKMTAARASARGQDCAIRFPGCRNETETVVLCHVRQFGGGGIGSKPDDAEAVYGCDHCHSRLDGRVPWINDAPADFDFWEHIARAIVRTQRVMRAKGVLIFKGEAA